VKVTLFPHITSDLTSVTEEFLDIRAFSELFQHRYDEKVREKKDIPCFFPGVFKKGEDKRRSGENVLAVYFGVLDFDAISLADISELMGLLEDLRLESLMYTTWSNRQSIEQKGVYKLRLVVPFNRAVEPKEWDVVWASLYETFGQLSGGSVADAACKNVGRIYYMPYLSYPAGADGMWEHDIVIYNHGLALDVDDLKDVGKSAAVVPAVVPGAAPGPVPGAAPKETQFSDVPLMREHLKGLISKLTKKSGSGDRQEEYFSAACAAWLKDIRAGKETRMRLPEEGHRHNGFWLPLTLALGEYFIDRTPEEIFDAFLKVLLIRVNQEKEDKASKPTEAKEVLDLLRGAQQLARRKQEEGGVLEEQEKKVADDVLGFLGDTTFTQEQMDEQAARMGFSRGVLKRLLIVNSQTSFYVYSPFVMSYRELLDRTVDVSVHKVLGSMKEALGLELHKTDQRGMIVRKNIIDLTEEYGRVDADIELSMFATTPKYLKPDGHRVNTLVLPAMSLKDAPTEKSEFIGRWLEALCEEEGPEKLKQLEQWIGWSIDLEHPLSMLLLLGPKGTGKSLFAEMLAYCWGTSYATPDVAFGAFPGSALLETPVVFFDEHFPADKTAQFRSIISKRKHTFNRKHMSLAEISGCYRFVVGANNARSLLGIQKEALTNDDMEALADRCFRVRVSKSAADFLVSAGSSRIQQAKENQEFLQHAKYLKHKWAFAERARFGTKPDEFLMQEIAISGGPNSLLMLWIYNFLLDTLDKRKPRTAFSGLRNKIKIQNRKLCLTQLAFHDMWDRYLPGDHKIPRDDLKIAFESITEARRGPRSKSVGSIGNEAVYYRNLRLDLFEKWLEDNWHSQDVLKALEKDTLTEET